MYRFLQIPHIIPVKQREGGIVPFEACFWSCQILLDTGGYNKCVNTVITKSDTTETLYETSAHWPFSHLKQDGPWTANCR